MHDVPGPPDVVSLGRLTLHVIERGGRFAIRLKDMDSAARREFKGLAWFPVDESYRVDARFVPYPSAAPAGRAERAGRDRADGQPGLRRVHACRATGTGSSRCSKSPDAQELFFIFRDETAGKETYPAGRFLYTALPRDGALVLDFNKAYTPPCAFTRFATCPLPPKEQSPEAAHPGGREGLRSTTDVRPRASDACVLDTRASALLRSHCALVTSRALAFGRSRPRWAASVRGRAGDVALGKG